MADNRIPLPNFGRLGNKPISLDHVYHDTDINKAVILRVWPHVSEGSTGWHWEINWVIHEEDEFYRVLHISNDSDRVGDGSWNRSIANWGPLTKHRGPASTSGSITIPIATLSKADRLGLEAIASNTQVYSYAGVRRGRPKYFKKP